LRISVFITGKYLTTITILYDYITVIKENDVGRRYNMLNHADGMIPRRRK